MSRKRERRGGGMLSLSFNFVSKSIKNIVTSYEIKLETIEIVHYFINPIM